jgi:type I restriction enzyme S subunit
VDELIAAQVRKVEALKTHKKGLMQQLFPREGETQPRLRFPEFQVAGGWDVKPFQKLFTIGSGRDYKHLSGGNIPVYGSGGYMLLVDDFLYDGESVCIGRKGTINNPMFLTGKFWTVDTLFYTHSFRDCLPKFIYAIFQNIDWLKHNEAGGVPSLSKTIIEKIQTAVPGTVEQQKIADCLSSVDELIAAQVRKVEALKTHKKGLMQQLFPSAEVDA